MKKIFLLLLIASIAFSAIPDGYYDNASGLSGTALKAALHNIIDGHTEKTYDFLWIGLRYTDEDPNNSSNFILIYTGRSLSKTQAYPDWNREHVWAKSHGDFGNVPPCGTDMHHLRPSDVSVNGDRGNKDFDNGGTQHSEATGCYYDSDSWEPRDEVKGDIARSMLYMTVRYEGDSGELDLELVDYTGTSGPNFGKLSTLLAWHIQDPVSDFESTRNDRVYSYQNNRNPFIDHPEYVSYIFGGEVPSDLSAPVAASASNIDLTSFTANWSSVSNADGYKLYVTEDASFSSLLSGYSPKTVTALSESISGLTTATDYYYKLKAYNSSEESLYSNVITVQTLEDGVAAPVATSATNVDSTSFTANWNAVTSATGYKLYVSDDDGFSSFLSGYSPKSLTLTSETITGLAPETDYYYKLKAVDADGESAFSNVISLTTLEGADTVITPPVTGDTDIETFANFPETGSSYMDGSFTGQNGTTWTYDQCRGDIKISDETPCLGKGRSPEASITSGTISGGMATLSFQYKQAYSTDVNLDVYVNGSKVATVTSSNESDIIKDSGPISVNVIGDVVLKFVQQSSTSGQVAIDNASWTSYTVAIDPVVPETFKIGSAYPNPFNPRCTLPLELTHDTYTEISLLDVLGNEKQHLHSGMISAGSHQIDIDGSDLSTGLYFVLVKHDSKNVMRKILLIK